MSSNQRKIDEQFVLKVILDVMEMYDTLITDIESGKITIAEAKQELKETRTVVTLMKQAE